MPMTGFNKWWHGPVVAQEYDERERQLQRQREAQEALQGIGQELTGQERSRMTPSAIRDFEREQEARGQMMGVGPAAEEMLMRLHSDEPPRVGDSVTKLPEIRAKLARLQLQYPDVESVQRAGKTFENLQAKEAIGDYFEAGVPALKAAKEFGNKSLLDEALSNPEMSPEEIQRIAEGQTLQDLGGGTKRGVGEVFLQGNTSEAAQAFRGSQGQQDLMGLEEKKFGLSLAEKMARLDKAARDAETGDADLEMKFKKLVNADPVVKDFQTIDSRFRGIASLWNDYAPKSPAERTQESKIALDQGLINLFNKILDPGSVVRESEFARTAQGQALMERVKGWLPKLKSGGTGLTDKERQEIVSAAETLYRAGLDAYETTTSDYRRLMSPYNVRPDVILGSVGREVYSARRLGDAGGSTNTPPGKRLAQTDAYARVRSNLSSEKQAELDSLLTGGN